MRSKSPISTYSVALGLAVLAVLYAVDRSVEADQPGSTSPTRVLAPVPTPRCDFTGSQVDRYRLLLNGQQTLRLSVEQKGIDVSVTLEDPYGEVLVRRDGLTGPVGEERIVAVIEESGDHILEVRALATVGPPGCYEVSFAVSDTVTPRDQARAAAWKTVAEATHSGVDREDAIRRLRQVALDAESLEDTTLLAETLSLLGNFHATEDPAAALTYLTRILNTSSTTPVLRAWAHQKMGDVYTLAVVDYDTAHEHYDEALRAWKGIYGAAYWEAKAAHQLGLVAHYMGDFTEALYNYNLAIQKAREVNHDDWRCSSLHNRGWIYYYLSRLDEATADFSAALEIDQNRDSPSIEVTLTSLSYIHTARKEYEKAFELLDRALALRAGDDRGRAVTLAALGWAKHRAGRPDEALQDYREALKVFEDLDDEASQAKIHHRIGLISQEGGDHAEAILHFERSLQGYRKLSSADGEAEAILAIARSDRDSGRDDIALEKADKAIEIIETLRRRPFNARLRALFFASKRHFFDFKIGLLMALHKRHPERRYDIDALAVSEQARARSLIETLTSSGVDLSAGRNSEILKKEKRLRRRIQVNLFQSQNQNQPVLVRDLRTELQQLELELDRAAARIRESHPLYASITQAAQPLSGAELQKVVDEETLLLEYYLGESQMVLWAVTSDAIKTFELDAKPGEIDERARKVYRLLPVGRQRKYRIQLEWELGRLSDILLKPVAGQLPEKKRLVIVCGGSLQYVPFAAMPTPGEEAAAGWPRRLFSSHEIVSVPSASTLATLRRVIGKDRMSASRTAVVLADPVFNSGDERVPGNGQHTRGIADNGFKRLAYSRREAEAVRRFLPDAKIATGFEASKALATSGELGEYRYVHLATHGTFDAQFPERSGLVFSLYDEAGDPLDGVLHLPEIYQLGFSADLVVLSACQTALGEEIRGEGLVGMVQGFMYSGSPRVIASLWNVLDESTAVFMELFYKNLLVDGLPPSAALRAAQVDFLERHPEWSEPFYWAGFILVGDF